MHYQFPRIRRIEDVLPAIQGAEEFIVVKKDGYTVINYTMLGNDTFPPITDELSAIRRECRGLIFCNRTGEVLSRRYHKFFNVGEREETLMAKVDFDKPHIKLLKLDGSMVSPIKLGDFIRWTTKMGITEVAMQAEVFVAKNPIYRELAARAMSTGWTPIFEWCSRKNRIVIDYPEDKLVLTAVRENEFGTYLHYNVIRQYAKEWGIPCVEEMADLPVPGEEDIEGMVVRFDDGHMCKIKTEWYVLRHNSKDAITREKNVISYIANEQVDDVLPYLIVEDQTRLLNFAMRFNDETSKIATGVAKRVQYLREDCVSRKEYALSVQYFPAWMRPLLFKCYDGQDARVALYELIKKACSSQTKIEASRLLWGGLKWNYGEYDV